MFSSLLLFCVSVNATYTIPIENRLTAQAATTKGITWFAAKQAQRGENKYDYLSIGEIICNTAEKAVLNCDIFVCANDHLRFIQSKIRDLLRHLTSVEAWVLEVLGHLQEV